MTIALPRQHMFVLGALALLIGAGTSAHAQNRIEDCEKIQAADAYNQCLAKFGPTSKVKNVTPAQPGDMKASDTEAAAAAMQKMPKSGRHIRHSRVSRRHGARHVVARTGGRKRMTISVTRHH